MAESSDPTIDPTKFIDSPLQAQYFSYANCYGADPPLSKGWKIFIISLYGVDGFALISLACGGAAGAAIGTGGLTGDKLLGYIFGAGVLPNAYYHLTADCPPQQQPGT